MVSVMESLRLLFIPGPHESCHLGILLRVDLDDLSATNRVSICSSLFLLMLLAAWASKLEFFRICDGC